MEHKLDDAIELVRLTPQNCEFFLTENGFLMIDTQIESKFIKEPPSGHKGGHVHVGSGDLGGGMPPPPEGPAMPRKQCIPEDKGDFSKENKPLIGKRRVFLHRAFPFDRPYEYISVSDENGEIGIIFDISEFTDSAQILRDELEEKYFAPKIKKVLSVKERFGYSYWKVICDRGNYDFTVKDTFKSIIHVSESRVFILDVDSNRFEIESLAALDRNSFRKIELYL